MVLEEFQVIITRFSGSEVCTGSEECAREVDALLRKAGAGA